MSRYAEAAAPNGRIVVLGGVCPDGAPRPVSIEMILAGGMHRTVVECRDLAQEAGLEVVAAEQKSSGYFVVECRPRRSG